MKLIDLTFEGNFNLLDNGYQTYPSFQNHDHSTPNPVFCRSFRITGQIIEYS